MGAQHSKKKKPTGHKRKQDHDWTFFLPSKAKNDSFRVKIAKFLEKKNGKIFIFVENWRNIYKLMIGLKCQNNDIFSLTCHFCHEIAFLWSKIADFGSEITSFWFKIVFWSEKIHLWSKNDPTALINHATETDKSLFRVRCNSRKIRSKFSKFSRVKSFENF